MSKTLIECRRAPARAGAPSLQRRAQGTGSGSLIVGHAAVFFRENDPGTEYVMEFYGFTIRERILPGCFDRALREAQDVCGLFNHDSNYLLGRTTSGTLRLRVDKIGLAYELDAPDTSAGRDVLALLKRGDLTGSSFAFKVKSERWTEVSGDDDKEEYCIREIMDVDLYDVSPVVTPAYASADSALGAGEPGRSLPPGYSAVPVRPMTPRRAAHMARQARMMEIEADLLTYGVRSK